VHASYHDILLSKQPLQRKEELLPGKTSDWALWDRRNHLLINHLEKIVSSRAFTRSDFLKRFLKFLVAKVLRSEEHQIKEYSLAIEVFGRKDSFDPKIDTIVRVQAHRFRAKLNQYYRTEGSNEQLRIDIPKGSYIPVITTLRNTNTNVSVRKHICRSSPRCRILILPFSDLSRKACSDHTLIDAIAETLIDDLALTDALEVVARISLPSSKRHQHDLSYLGKQLKLDVVLKGSMQIVKRVLRVKARLVSVSTESVVWSTTFDLSYLDRLTVQEQISSTIVPSIVALVAPPIHEQSVLKIVAS
jgi:TolB-like protein